MSASFDFEFEENEIPPNSQESLDAAPAAAGEHAISQIYAAAWSMAHRDHELDKLFNFEFYQQQ
jgi:hypothetical protein